MPFPFGASDEARTRYLHLGKVALYQMSYTRNDKRDCSREIEICQEKNENFLQKFFDCKYRLVRRKTALVFRRQISYNGMALKAGFRRNAFRWTKKTEVSHD